MNKFLSSPPIFLLSQQWLVSKRPFAYKQKPSQEILLPKGRKTAERSHEGIDGLFCEVLHHHHMSQFAAKAWILVMCQLVLVGQF